MCRTLNALTLAPAPADDPFASLRPLLAEVDRWRAERAHAEEDLEGVRHLEAEAQRALLDELRRRLGGG